MKTNIYSNKLPLVSIVMPVFNASKYVGEAIASLVNQTYPNIEIIIVDDCSTDHSWLVIQSFANNYPNIKIARNEVNKGIAATVNRAIKMSTGKYLARLDADDISFPNRIKLQVDYLESHKETVALGGQCEVINSESVQIGNKTFPTSFEDIYKYIFMYVPVQQSTLMIARNRLPRKAVYYREDMVIAEEIELFFQIFQFGKIENLADYLVKYRLHNSNNSFQKVKRIFWLTLLCRVRAVLKYGYKPDFLGVLVTIAQLLLVVCLPESIIIGLYKILRDWKTMLGKGNIKSGVQIKTSTVGA